MKKIFYSWVKTKKDLIKNIIIMWVAIPWMTVVVCWRSHHWDLKDVLTIEPWIFGIITALLWTIGLIIGYFVVKKRQAKQEEQEKSIDNNVQAVEEVENKSVPKTTDDKSQS